MKNTKNFIKSISLLLAVLMAALAFGCAKKTEETAPVVDLEGLDAPAATATSAAVLERGGELYVPMPEDMSALDPLNAPREDMQNIYGLMYESPFRLSAGGNVATNLVETWEVDETGTIFTFVLRSGVVFHDGQTPLQANDIVTSAQRVLALTSDTNALSAEQPEDPEDTQTPEATAAPSASASIAPYELQTGRDDDGNTVVMTEDVSEVIPRRNLYAKYNHLVQSIEAVDENTVRLTMREPGQAGLYFMLFPVMSDSLTEGGTLPMGTGPYILESFSSADGMVLNASETWWGGLPHIERVVAKPLDSTDEKLESVSTSVLDFITTDVLYAGKYNLAGKTQVLDYMTNNYECLLPNLNVTALQDVRVRQAISYALNRREIISTVLLNHAVPANLPVASDFYAYNPKYKNDVDQNVAKQLLEQAGYKTGENSAGTELRLKLMLPDDRDKSYRIEAGKAIKKQLGQVGVLLDLEYVAPLDYIARLQSGDFELAYAGFHLSENPSLEFMLAPDGEANFNGVSNESLNTAMAAYAAAVTEEDRIATMDALQQVLCNDLPQIGLFYLTNSIICDASLQNLQGMREHRVFAEIQKWYYQ